MKESLRLDDAHAEYASDHAPLMEDGYWVCACGQLNTNNATCLDCMVDPQRYRQHEEESDIRKMAEDRAEDKVSSSGIQSFEKVSDTEARMTIEMPFEKKSSGSKGSSESSYSYPATGIKVAVTSKQLGEEVAVCEANV